MTMVLIEDVVSDCLDREHVDVVVIEFFVLIPRMTENAKKRSLIPPKLLKEVKPLT